MTEERIVRDRGTSWTGNQKGRLTLHGSEPRRATAASAGRLRRMGEHQTGGPRSRQAAR